MANPIGTDDRQKWRGCLSDVQSGLERVPLNEDVVKSHVAGWIGESVNPENPAITATIVEVRDQSVALKLPGGNFHSCPFREIIDAETVILYWLAKGKAPDTSDFRDPDAAIGVPPIYNNSYAPALAERVRRAEIDKSVLRPWRQAMNRVRRSRKNRLYMPTALLAAISYLEDQLRGAEVPNFLIPFEEVEKRFRNAMGHLGSANKRKANLAFYRLSNHAKVWALHFGTDPTPLNHVRGQRQNPPAAWLQKKDVRARFNEELLPALLDDGTRGIIVAELTQMLKELAATLDATTSFPTEVDPLDRSAAAEKGQGFGLTAAERKAIERHAQQMAEDYFIRLGYEVTDVSLTNSYDLHCVREDETLRVEVKGTTGEGDSILLTRNEVELSRQNPRCSALFVVRNIVLYRVDEKPIADGGETHVRHPWNVDECTLTPLQFECRLPKPNAVRE